jgi:hypothetical protein
MFRDSLGAMPPRWGWRSINDGVYKHVAPLELADESIPLIQRQWVRSPWSRTTDNALRTTDLIHFNRILLKDWLVAIRLGDRMYATRPSLWKPMT